MATYLKFLVLIFAVTCFSACEQSATTKHPVKLTDSARAAIQAEAQDHLIDMITLIKLNGAGNKTFKFLVMSADKSGVKDQYTWGHIFEMQNDSFKCVVVNPVPKTAKAKFGDTILVSQGDVADWKVGDLGRGNNFGDFTGAYLKNAK